MAQMGGSLRLQDQVTQMVLARNYPRLLCLLYLYLGCPSPASQKGVPLTLQDLSA